MNNGVEFTYRGLNEYESTLGPKLLLIIDKPLPYDKNEIMNSPAGIKYLSTCFKSKFKSAETHVTYIENEKNISFVRETFFEILEEYIRRGNLDLNQFIIGFVGKKAFDLFINEIQTTPEKPTQTIWYKEDLHSLRIFDPKIHLTEYSYIPVIVLPNVDEDYSNIIELLNNTKTAENIKVSPYSTTSEIIDKINIIINLYEEGHINGFKYNCKFYLNENGSKKTEYFKIFDAYTGLELLYSIKDEKVENDTLELKKEFYNKIKELFTKVPVYSDDIEEVISSFKNINIKTISKEDCLKVDSTRASFIFIGDESDPNGQKSEWYDKWYKNAYLPKIKKELSQKQIQRDGYDIPYRYEWVYDIEVFKYDWLFVAKTLDKKNTVICWNDPDNLRRWIKDKILIGFNNSGYDDSVIRHAMSYPYSVEGTMTVKEFSDTLIEDKDGIKRFPEFKPEFKLKEYKNGYPINENGEIMKEDITPPNFISWDISLHLPFDIRRNSLKKLTMSVLDRRNYDSSVPFDIQTPLTPQQREDVEKYCEMDVDNTLDLFLPKPGDLEKKAEDPKYKMREFARDSYDIKWNLIVEYNMKALNLITKSASFAGKVLCGENAKPNLKNTWKEVNGEKVYYSIPELAMKELAGHPVLDFYLQHQKDPNYIHEKFEYHMGGDDESHLYQFGFGGLHQALINYTGHNLCNFDVASLYPSLLIQYNLMSRGAAANPGSYRQVYDTRIEAKHTGKTLLNQGLKLVLNGAIGAMLSNYNPLYDTWSNSTICVHGQLLLFILCKRLFEAGFVIVQTNTDGIMVEKRDDIDFMTICKKWEEETRLVLEYDDIDIVAQNNVNNYYCRFSEPHPKVKSKGVYLSNEKFGVATAKILCNMVTERPLLEGCLPRDFVIFKRHSVGEIYYADTNKKVEGRSLAFVVGKENDPRTQAFYSRSRNEREVAVKDEKGKTLKDENGNQVTEIIHSISKISGFTDHMLLVDDMNNLTIDEINTSAYISFAKNLLCKTDIFGPYYDINYTKCDEPAYLQALNAFKDNTAEYPTNSNVICQNFLFECDYLTKEEQEELFKPIEKYTYRIVWSGHRSYHIVIRLNKPVTSLTYKKIWYYMQYRLGLIGADQQTCIPSKYTRVPDEINPKTGEMQTLYSENKYEFDLDEILEKMPKLKEELKQPTIYKGKVDMKALERHLKRLDWSEGNRFVACQKLSPILISQVSMEELLTMIPVKLERDHKYIIRSKYHFYQKNKDLYEQN